MGLMLRDLVVPYVKVVVEAIIEVDEITKEEMQMRLGEVSDRNLGKHTKLSMEGE